MDSNPYLQHQPEQNPYLKAANQDAATAQIIQNLTQLIPGQTVDPADSPSQATRSDYRSALDSTSPSGSVGYGFSPTTNSSPHSNPYRSPDEIVQAEQARQRQEQERSRQESLRQQQLAQAQAQEAAAARRALERQAQQFLATLDKLDPLEGDRLWFEAFAELCPSRLEAAIEFIQTIH